MPRAREHWAAGEHYEDFMGRWSRQLAPKFLSWLQIPTGAHWLDVGCGTGALTNAICALASPASVVGCDPSEAFIEHARRRSNDARVTFVHSGVGALPRHADGYGSVTSLLALNFFPDVEASIVEMRDLAVRGGTVSACVWDYAGRMDFLRLFWDAAIEVDANARGLDEGRRFPICHPQALVALFRRGGLHQVSCEPLEIPTPYASFDEFWDSFLGGTGPAPSYVASLSAAARERLARKLKETVPLQSDGSIDLIARAWAVRGTAN